MSRYAEASRYTYDKKLQKILLECSKGKFPKKFSEEDGYIILHSGKRYSIPSDPMDLCNMVHFIMWDKKVEEERRPVTVCREGFPSMIELYSYAREYYGMNDAMDWVSRVKIAYDAGKISARDVKWKDGKITRIENI